MNLLSGISHAIVTVPSREDSAQSGVVASVELCFGDDQTSIAHVHRARGVDNRLVWNVPHVQIVKDGRQQMSPVFRGKLLVQLCTVAERALERIKKDVGRPEYGKRYRVADNQAVLDEVQQAAEVVA